ncbi:MAG: hypothetical protein BWY64_02936 [bacterium ADurb.Bin363]|nr:MAG: hypothetical protein BWY64_02936 [bacterium ADurb.Bin363]
MIKSCFLDTSYLIALINTNDRWHKVANYWQEEVIKNNILLITTEYILVELADGLSVLKFRYKAAQMVSLLKNIRYVNIIPASTILFDADLALFKNRLDKEWSLTDCISMIVVHDYSIKDILSSDRHFVQAGYQVLLKD